MTPRRRAILIVILALLLIAIVVATVLYLLRARPKPAGAGDATVPVLTPSAPAPTPTAVSAFQNPLNPPAPSVDKSRTAAAQMAELFAERYGSYSNQGDFQNLRDLLPVMTDAYRASTETYLATAKSDPNAPYEGVTSVKISTDVRSYDATGGTAVIAVMLQQQKVSGASRATPTYRSLKMSLQKVGQDWRVASATWEN